MKIVPFERSFASHEKSKYWSNKNIGKPEEIFSSSNKKYIFNCNNCGHDFDASLTNVSNNNSWCPYCSGKKLCGNKECINCYNKSFASHQKSKCWSNKNIEKPENVSKSSHKKYIFNCDSCIHEFTTTLNSVTDGRWCGYCYNKICTDKECVPCFNKSFASHPKAKYWSYKNHIKPREASKSSNKKFLFNCKTCRHEFYTTLSDITIGNCWCPYCSSKKLCGNKECINCYNKSFASHPKSKCWSNKNIEKPENVSKSSHKKYIFNCDSCIHEFITTLNSVTDGRWCPKCTHKTEKKLFEYFISIYPKVIHQYKVDWCKSKTYLPFDFCLELFEASLGFI